MSQNEYTVEDQDEVVKAVRKSLASRLVVEFLQQGGPKPHVVCRLDISPIKANGTTWFGCRLAMDLEGGYEGTFHITPLKYSGSSHAAHAAFEFALKRTDWTVDHIISTIQDKPNLLGFSFQGGFKQPGSKIEYVDGCRDFISQFFIIIHRWGLVGWHVHKIERGKFDGSNLRVEVGKTGFHSIIGYNFVINPSGSTLVTSLPLARGKFWDEKFRRVLSYQVSNKYPYELPYAPGTPQEGDENFAGKIASSGQSASSSTGIGGTSLPSKFVAQSDPVYVWTWWVESKTGNSYEFQREDGGRIHTEASDWKPDNVSYEGKWVNCWMYTGKNTGNRYYTWEMGSGTDPKGKSKEIGKGKGK